MDDLTSAEVQALRRSCRRFVHGNGYRSAADYLSEIPKETELDFYGGGGVVEELERETAAVLGKPAAVFMPSGVMAQQIALRIAADRCGRRGVLFHPHCHIDTKELRSYELLHGLEGTPVGEPHRLLKRSDLERYRWFGEPITAPAALVLELPQRDLGGLLPAWDDLVSQVEWARERGAAVHLDGARLWGCPPYYERSLDEIAGLFDTVYVSFYKQLAGLSGAALAGPADVINEARAWRRRHGGTLPHLWPNAASGLAGLRTRLPQLPALHEHAVAIAAAVRGLDNVVVVPDPPQTTMFHLLLHRDAQTLTQAALRLAREEEIWTFYRPQGTEVPDLQRWEIEVGAATLTWTPAEFQDLIHRLLTT